MGKKILVVCQHFWPENFRLNDLCDGFIENGYEVEVLCGIPNYPKGEWFHEYGYFKNRRQLHNGIHIRRVAEIKRKGNSNLRIFLNYISFPIASLFHLPYLFTQKYDKIFIYQLSPVMMSLTGIVLGKIKKIETTMYVLDLWPENLYSVLSVSNSFLRSIAEKVSHWHYKNVNKIIGVSGKMTKVLQQISCLPEEKLLFMPQCCEKIYETDILDEALHQRFSSGFNLVYTGNISPAQSFETVLEATDYLIKDGIVDINWIIVGDGMTRHWLNEQVFMRGLSKYFFFEGYQPIEAIPKYTGIADALLACLVKSDLLDCAIPAKVMSYFASGKPMILAMDGEAQTIVNDVECGFAGPSGDSIQLYQNIKRMYLMDKNKRHTMGQNGKVYHLNHFERNQAIKKFSILYIKNKGTKSIYGKEFPNPDHHPCLQRS